MGGSGFSGVGALAQVLLLEGVAKSGIDLFVKEGFQVSTFTLMVTR